MNMKTLISSYCCGNNKNRLNKEYCRGIKQMPQAHSFHFSRPRGLFYMSIACLVICARENDGTALASKTCTPPMRICKVIPNKPPTKQLNMDMEVYIVSPVHCPFDILLEDILSNSQTIHNQSPLDNKLHKTWTGFQKLYEYLGLPRKDT